MTPVATVVPSSKMETEWTVVLLRVETETISTPVTKFEERRCNVSIRCKLTGIENCTRRR